ncbi:MAG: bifunctional phosphoribosylaminoimidazolecarboxamide formyltransferase/IMP cyclohydrolase [Patescibacteria group bacterium]|jgi:phosphoribosylaminoimidazolecarboxamide formyltransferase/IMP cyclohydrolase
MEKYALLSVSDKEGLTDLARSLDLAGYRLIATGGTAKALTEAGLTPVPIQEITGNPESFDGRMKTISFEVMSGILFDRANEEHVRQAQELSIKPIDIVVCNLYPFEKTSASENSTAKEAIENIDVGGPTMIRSAAKNHLHVLPIVDPKDYETVAKAIAENAITKELRQKLAAKAFRHLSFYDAQIAGYFGSEMFPEEFVLAGRKMKDLRYGENPHQKAAAYITPGKKTAISGLKCLAGRDISLTNLTDINSGLIAVELFSEPAAAVIKHNSPCGLALGSTAEEALTRAIEADSESAFGGVIVLNKPMDKKCADLIASFKDEKRGNIDIIAVPEVDAEVLEFLKGVRKTMGIYSLGKINPPDPKGINLKWIEGGFVVQTADNGIDENFSAWEFPTQLKPTEEQINQMRIAWKFLTRIRSNAILVMDPKLPMTRGIGTGQTSRVRAVRIALEQAGQFSQEAVMASDSFFPFDDSVKLAAKAGIKAIVQQGGSINDKLSIAAADAAGIAMVFTRRRAFWH